jgi:hypothetical protein
MCTRFHDFAANLKPALDRAFTDQLTRLLGDTQPLRSWSGEKLLTGGKKIRGSLLCLVATTLGGPLESALPRAVAVELIQTATLIHDDFVDQHRVRRNEPAIWTLEGARRAVLLGDIVFSSAIQMMSEMGQEDGLVVSRAIAEVSRGAFQEPLNPAALLEKFEADGTDGALYEKIIYLKTGALFGAACQLGAVAAGADARLQQIWRRYGVNIGEAYQIADDIHDVEHALLSRCVTPGELNALAPSLLFFAGEIRPYLSEALRGEAVALEGEVLERFRGAAVLMRAEKKKRVLSAVDAIAGEFPDTGRNRLARRAPGDIIRMFDAAASVR